MTGFPPPSPQLDRIVGIWYRPKDAKKYRLIYADLSVREADAAPTVPNAQPLPSALSPKK